MGKIDPIMEKFNSSLEYDQRMWDADIRGSKAYVKALEKAKLVTTDEMNQILLGLDQVILSEFQWISSLEEIGDTYKMKKRVCKNDEGTDAKMAPDNNEDVQNGNVAFLS